MKKLKSDCFPKDDKIQTGLRIPESRYNELKAMADKSGASINSIILFLVDVGLTAVTAGIEQASQHAPRIPEHTGE